MNDVVVGDVCRLGSVEYVITYINSDGYVAGIRIDDGTVIPEKFRVHKNDMVKTDRHIELDFIKKSERDMGYME